MPNLPSSPPLGDAFAQPDCTGASARTELVREDAGRVVNRKAPYVHLDSAKPISLDALNLVRLRPIDIRATGP
jgi:hypothetical protein